MTDELDWIRCNQLLKRRFFKRLINEQDYRKILNIFGLEMLLCLLSVYQDDNRLDLCKKIRQQIDWVMAASFRPIILN